MCEAVFSRPAVLFAENFKVVEAMRTAFEASLDEFYKSLTQRVRELVSPAVLLESQSATFWYLWIGEREGDEANRPSLWWRRYDPKAVRPGKLKIRAQWDRADEGERNRIAALSARDDLRQWVIRGSTNDALLQMEADFSTCENVEESAQRMSRLLRAMREAELGGS